jgi:acetolactate synthase-1/2/3 large subunit
VDAEVLGANFAPRWQVRSPVAAFLASVLAGLGSPAADSDWTTADAATWRRSLREASLPNPPEPRFAGHGAAEFFAALQGALPAGAIVVTDTGQHQIMTRAHLRVESCRGLLVPADFQSMGFGLPAAIGAALAAPDRKVVAILGDGGMMMSGLELATAVRERLDLVAIVLRDGHLGQIRAQQAGSGTGEAAVKLASIDFGALAAATGAHYLCVERDAAATLHQACRTSGVVLVDVPLGDSPAMQRVRWAGTLRGTARRTLGERGRGVVRRLLGRR